MPADGIRLPVADVLLPTGSMPLGGLVASERRRHAPDTYSLCAALRHPSLFSLCPVRTFVEGSIAEISHEDRQFFVKSLRGSVEKRNRGESKPAYADCCA